MWLLLLVLLPSIRHPLAPTVISFSDRESCEIARQIEEQKERTLLAKCISQEEYFPHE